MSTAQNSCDFLIAGGGAAGMAAAVMAGREGAKVVLAAGRERCGRKLRITGKGRCNVTNQCPPQEFLKNIVTNARFMKSAVYRFTPEDAMAFFEDLGVPLKTERGNRVFPVSDSAADVVDVLLRGMDRAGVRIVHQPVETLLVEDGRVLGVRTSAGEIIHSPRVLLATGGLSYPATGSTGDGYRLARECGHGIVPAAASLVPLEAGPDCEALQGLSLKNVQLSLYEDNRRIFNEQGEMLFTHFGVSGPLVLSASVFCRSRTMNYRLEIDLKPALTQEKLDERILRDFAENKNRCFRNSLDALLPQKMIPVIIARSQIDPDERVNSITREQRLRLGGCIKHFTLDVYGPRPVEEAIITAGGVDVKEINPRSMESRLVSGLYFAGEIMDVDAYTGGFNLQIAWSSAYCAAHAVLEDLESEE